MTSFVTQKVCYRLRSSYAMFVFVSTLRIRPSIPDPMNFTYFCYRDIVGILRIIKYNFKRNSMCFVQTNIACQPSLYFLSIWISYQYFFNVMNTVCAPHRFCHAVVILCIACNMSSVVCFLQLSFILSLGPTSVLLALFSLLCHCHVLKWFV